MRRPAANNFDDMPIGGNKPPVSFDTNDEEDRPLPKGSYNLDALGAEAYGEAPARNPKKEAP